MLNYKGFIPFLCSLFLVLFSGCEEEVEVFPASTLSDLFALEMGTTRLYHVLDSSFDVSGPIVEEYIRKERVVGTTTDLEGRLLYQIEVLKGPLSQANFQVSHRWNLYIPPEGATQDFVERTEDNVRTLVLGIPVKTGWEWDGNRFNTRDTRNFSYISTDSVVQVAAGTFEGCVVVEEGAVRNSAIRFAEAFSVYHPGLGPVLRYQKEVVFDGPNLEFNPDVSRIYREELIAVEP